MAPFPESKISVVAVRPEKISHDHAPLPLSASNFSHPTRGEFLGALSPAQIKTLIDQVGRQHPLTGIDLPNGIRVEVRLRAWMEDSFYLTRTSRDGRAESYLYTNGQFVLFGGHDGVINLNPADKTALSEVDAKAKAEGQKFVRALRVSLDEATKERAKVEKNSVAPTERLKITRQVSGGDSGTALNKEEALKIGILLDPEGKVRGTRPSEWPGFYVQQKKDAQTLFRYRYDDAGNFLECEHFTPRKNSTWWDSVSSSRTLEEEKLGDDLIKALKANLVQQRR